MVAAMTNRSRAAAQTAPIVRDYGTLSTDTTIQPSTADAHLIVLGGDITLTFDTASVPDRSIARVFLTQDATGSRLATWSGVTWISGSAPTLKTAADAIDLLEFFYATAAATWYGAVVA